MKTKLLSLILLSLVLATVAHAQKRAFTIEDLYRLKSVSGVHISPDGKSVVYVVATSDLPRAKRVSHVWLMDVDGRNARQLTYGAKGEGSPQFSPDGKRLLFISSRDGSPSLYTMPMGGGEARRLTSISTGVSDPLWSPDGKWIAFSTDVYPECGSDDSCNKKIGDTWSGGPLKAHMAEGLLYRHWTEWKDGTRTHVFLANAETGDVRDVTPGDFDSPPFQLGGPLQYDFSPDSAELVFVSNHDKVPATSTNNDLWLVSLTDKQSQPRNITAANRAYDGSPKYSPDGKSIAYRMQKVPAYESDLFRLAIYDRASGTSTVVTESFKNWVDSFDWSRDSRSLYFTGPVEGINPIYRLDLNSRNITQLLADKTIDEFEFSDDGRRIFYVKHSTGEPRDRGRAGVQSDAAHNHQ
jgi:Tol biopolymer transport system component